MAENNDFSADSDCKHIGEHWREITPHKNWLPIEHEITKTLVLASFDYKGGSLSKRGLWASRFALTLGWGEKGSMGKTTLPLDSQVSGGQVENPTKTFITEDFPHQSGRSPNLGQFKINN